MLNEVIDFGRGAFGSSGGKTRIAKKIVKMMPKHKTYVEPFAGGAAVFWEKEPSDIEVLNDKDPEIAFAYRFIRDCSDADMRELEKLDWVAKKSTFDKVYKMTPRSDAQRFYKFFYLRVLSYGMKGYKAGFVSMKKEGTELAICKKIPRLKERLKNVKIYNASYDQLLKQYDSEDTFFYLDPPYKDTTGFTHMEIDEEDFMSNVKSLRGKVLISYKLGTKLFDGLTKKKIKVPQTMDSGTGDKFRYEVVAANYDMLAFEKEYFNLTSRIGDAIILGSGSNNNTSNRHRKNASVAFRVMDDFIQIDAGNPISETKIKPAIMFITHSHDDHVKYINEFSDVPIYAPEDVWKDIDMSKLEDPIPLESNEWVTIGGFSVMPFEVEHSSKVKTYGYIFKDSSRSIVYMPDVYKLKDETKEFLNNNDLWIIGGMSYENDIRDEDFSYASIKSILEWSEKLKPKNIYFTHIGQDSVNNIDKIAETKTPINVKMAQDNEMIQKIDFVKKEHLDRMKDTILVKDFISITDYNPKTGNMEFLIKSDSSNDEVKKYIYNALESMLPKTFFEKISISFNKKNPSCSCIPLYSLALVKRDNPEIQNYHKSKIYFMHNVDKWPAWITTKLERLMANKIKLPFAIKSVDDKELIYFYLPDEREINNMNKEDVIRYNENSDKGTCFVFGMKNKIKDNIRNKIISLAEPQKSELLKDAEIYGEYSCEELTDKKIKVKLFQAENKRQLDKPLLFMITNIEDRNIISLSSLSDDNIQKDIHTKIYVMTSMDFSRKRIADELSISESTVYRYQKSLGLI